MSQSSLSARSWASPPAALAPQRGPLAWHGARHRLGRTASGAAAAGGGTQVAARCTQAVVVSCMHLAHEMAQREVGAYAWVVPSSKDPAGSTLAIMKAYQELLAATSATPLPVRTLPDPSRGLIQHHLQRARLAAGPDDYVVVLYSAHGIQEPPTDAGELWCYDVGFDDCLAKGTGPSEYIPILLFDYLTWAGASAAYVWDTPYAGRFVRAAAAEAAEIDAQLRAAAAQSPAVARAHPAVYAERGVHFAACGADQALPRPPHMPDDLFTACLVSPCRAALAWHNAQTFPLTTAAAGGEPGNERRSDAYMRELFGALGAGLERTLWAELSAIARTIAWQTMAPATYALLLSSTGDALATLTCGFLLAQRVLGSFGVQPTSAPAIPQTTAHALWTTWDMALDAFFAQLPGRLDEAGWQGRLAHPTFVSDQLDGVLAEQPAIGGDPSSARNQEAALARLPVVCHAARELAHRARAAAALDKCLGALDAASLARAIQGGALDAALHLLVAGGGAALPPERVTSVWAALIRHDASVDALLGTAALVAPDQAADSLTDLPAIAFFLDALGSRLDGAGSTDAAGAAAAVQAAAVLASVVGRRCDDALGLRCLDLGARMLAHEQGGVQTWGALLAACVLAHGAAAHLGASPRLYACLLERATAGGAETRAAAVYALARFLPRDAAPAALVPALAMAARVVGEAEREASPLVRRQLGVLAADALAKAGRYSVLALVLHWISRGVQTSAEASGDVHARLADARQAAADAGIAQCLPHLTVVLAAVESMQSDPATEVVEAVRPCWEWLASGVRPHLDTAWDDRLAALVASTQQGEITPELLPVLCQVATSVARSLSDPSGPSHPPPPEPADQSLFESFREALRVGQPQEVSTAGLDAVEAGPGRGEQTWLQRHRMLEDALVVAEQQAHLPWEWAMKEIRSPEPWASIACHSFTNVVLATTNSADLLFWDWSTGRSLGATRLRVPAGSYVSGARFVNELYEHSVVLAEITSGDVQVLAPSPDEGERYEPLSAFRALDMARPPGAPERRPLRTAWFRPKGWLCVGGAAGVVNVWDCPAERKVLAMPTLAPADVTDVAPEPRAGNLVLAGLADGAVLLFDTRVAPCAPSLRWDTTGATGATGATGTTGSPALARAGRRAVLRVGVVLGESSNVTAANANGTITVHDLRHLAAPVSSALAQPAGTACAHFQAHSGLTTTVSALGGGAAGAAGVAAPAVEWALHRSSTDRLREVSRDVVRFDAQDAGAAARSAPYTAFHPLRPFLAVGYGRHCVMRGAGRGSGDDTDSGSYAFLEQQDRLLRAHADRRAARG